MIAAKSHPPEPSREPAAVIARYLRDGDDLTRCLAAKALGRVGGPVAAEALVAALLDQDPDVRSDAMTALLHSARPEDAAAIRRSLTGDPVQEVKLAAIRTLARLGDQASVALLRGLAKSRLEDEVVWDDEAGMWDDWLDIQLTAVEALGDLAAGEAIEDLQAARSDEMGQELDGAVFAALARMPEGGVAALVGSLRDRDPRVRARALAALAKARPAVLTSMIDLFLEDAEPAVRLLAVGCLASDDPRLAELAGQDPDPQLRREALLRCAAVRPAVVLAALSDPDEEVRAAALAPLALQDRRPEGDDLIANLRAWMQTAGSQLAAESASVLAKLDSAGAAGALLGLARDEARPMAGRLAALHALETIDARRLAESLAGLAVDPARPLRAAALAGLARCCDRATMPAERLAAEVALVRAMGGELCQDTGVVSDPGDDAPDLAASKVEDPGPRQIAITPEGEIVDRKSEPPLPKSDGNVIRVRFPRSTLEAIQAPIESPPSEGDVALSDEDLSFLALAGQGRRRQRVSVDGPAEIADDIRILALRVGAACGGAAVEQAIAAALGAPMAAVRVAAFEALALRAAARPIAPALWPSIANALGDPAPVIRGLAARALRAAMPNAAEELASHLNDPDATVRAEALKAVGRDAPETRLAGLSDPASLVRQTALQLVLDQGDQDELARALEICMAAGAVEVIRKACSLSDRAVELVMFSLSSGHLSEPQARTLLDAMAQVP